MFRLFSALCFIPVLFSTQLNAQNAEVFMAVYDRESGEAWGFTNVTLLNDTESSLVAGGTTTLEGVFHLKHCPEIMCSKYLLSDIGTIFKK